MWSMCLLRRTISMFCLSAMLLLLLLALPPLPPPSSWCCSGIKTCSAARAESAAFRMAGLISVEERRRLEKRKGDVTELVVCTYV